MISGIRIQKKNIQKFDRKIDRIQTFILTKNIVVLYRKGDYE